MIDSTVVVLVRASEEFFDCSHKRDDLGNSHKQGEIASRHTSEDSNAVAKRTDVLTPVTREGFALAPYQDGDG